MGTRTCRIIRLRSQTTRLGVLHPEQMAKPVQLIISAVKGSAAVGKRMRVSGTLSGAQSAHHRTPVLLTVKEMTPSP